MSQIRAASHSGSWYTAEPQRLEKEVDEYLEGSEGKIRGARVVVGPHAGYFYAGETLGKTYGALDLTGIDRVFIMGPSHHVYFKGYALTSACSAYETPFGDIPVDTAVVRTLTAGKLFRTMSLDVDEDEHSFEMHVPFLYRACSTNGWKVPKIVPIMISGSSAEFELALAESLKPYFADKANAFVVSTDFCHWGARFGYTAYTPSGAMSDLAQQPSKVSIPIYKSIEALDHKGMELLTQGSFVAFREYIQETGNTICGAKPLSVLLALMESAKQSSYGTAGTLEWLAYAQSSQVKSPRDSSVSYAAGYAIV